MLDNLDLELGDVNKLMEEHSPDFFLKVMNAYLQAFVSIWV